MISSEDIDPNNTTVETHKDISPSIFTAISGSEDASVSDRATTPITMSVRHSRYRASEIKRQPILQEYQESGDR